MEFANFGEESDQKIRAAKLDEGWKSWPAAGAGERFSYHGAHYQLDDVQFLPVPVQPRIPIWVAATWPVPAPFRRAARVDGTWPLRRNPDKTAAPLHARRRPRYSPAHGRAAEHDRTVRHPRPRRHSANDATAAAAAAREFADRSHVVDGDGSTRRAAHSPTCAAASRPARLARARPRRQRQLAGSSRSGPRDSVRAGAAPPKAAANAPSAADPASMTAASEATTCQYLSPVMTLPGQLRTDRRRIRLVTRGVLAPGHSIGDRASVPVYTLPSRYRTSD